MSVKLDASAQNPLWKIQTGNLKPISVVRPSLPPTPVDQFKGPTTHAEYKQGLRGLPDAMLQAERTRLQEKIRDASSGPLKDDQAATRARAQLAEVEEELKARDGFATSADPAFARTVHTESTPQIVAEMAKQAERLNEASTGLSQDPAAAADARRKLEVMRKELHGRVLDAFQGKLPEDPPSQKMGVISKAFYGFQLATMDEKGLQAEKSKQEALLKDATTGGDADPVAAENARTRLEMVNKSLERFAPPSTIAGYKTGLRTQTDAGLEAEKAKLEAFVADAGTGPSRDPAAVKLAEEKLKLIDEEQKVRDGFASAPQPEYSSKVHGMTDAQVQAERAVQQERYREATTGLDRDPAKARDAQEKLSALMGETLRRTFDGWRGSLPIDPPTRAVSARALNTFRDGLRDDSDASLDAKRARLERTIADASSGEHTDPVQVENAKKKLALLDDELADRARLAAGPQPEYAGQMHGKTDAELKREVQKQWERLTEASTGLAQDPAVAADAREKLAVLSAELKDRREDKERIAPGFSLKPFLQAVVG